MWKMKAWMMAFGAALVGVSLQMPSASAQQSGEEAMRGAIQIEVGRAKTLRLDRIPSTIMFGNPDVADIVIERDGLIFLIGLRAGQTSLHLLDQNGASLLTTDIVVRPENRSQVTFFQGALETTYYCNPQCIRRANPRAAAYGGGSGFGGVAGGGGAAGAVGIFDDVPTANVRDRR